KTTTESESDAECATEEKSMDLPPLNYFALFICFVIKAVQQIFYANVETNTPSFIKWMFDFTSDGTSNVVSALAAGSGLLGFIFLVCYVWTGFSKNRAFKISCYLL
ncbi:hypothetical protein PMAYCL1PPCAC_31441, partial [Pristionchus mayeri]